MQFSRLRLLAGDEGMEKIHNAHIAVFGIGGVGGYAAEALVRSGVGRIDIFDNDKVDITNINRQIIATHKTVGRYKTDVMTERMLEINPDIEVKAHRCFYMPENADEYDFSGYSYIIDAIDTVTGKLEIITRAYRMGIPVISCMGAGNKLDASAFEVEDIYKTSVCPLARVMRHELKKRNVSRLKVVYSKEKPIVCGNSADSSGKKVFPGSMAAVPAAAGLIAAGEVIKDILSE